MQQWHDCRKVIKHADSGAPLPAILPLWCNYEKFTYPLCVAASYLKSRGNIIAPTQLVVSWGSNEYMQNACHRISTQSMLTTMIIHSFYAAIGLRTQEWIGGTGGEWLNYCFLELGQDPEICSEMLCLRNVNSESIFNQCKERLVDRVRQGINCSGRVAIISVTIWS